MVYMKNIWQFSQSVWNKPINSQHEERKPILSEDWNGKRADGTAGYPK